MTRLLLATVLLITVTACASADDSASDTMTQRQRDSAIGESSLPGAGGVRAAARVADSADARNARLDSIAAEP